MNTQQVYHLIFLFCSQWNFSIYESFQDTALYHIVSNPFETKNVLQDHRAIAKELKLLHDTWSNSLPKPRWPSMIYYEYKDGEQIRYYDQ